MCCGRILFDFVPKGQNFRPEQIQGAKDKALLKKEVSARDARHAGSGTDAGKDRPGGLR